jgi:uncharacterized FlaG/YvyC family protein
MQEFIDGKLVKVRIPANYGFHDHSSISLIKVTEKNDGKNIERILKL